jgi:transposase-like protein
MNENGKNPRRQFTAALKYQVLREARQTGTPVSQVCAKHQISPTLFYQWERAAERGALTALNHQPRGRKKLRPSEEALLIEIHRLREVVVELSTENLQLKKGRWP